MGSRLGRTQRCSPCFLVCPSTWRRSHSRSLHARILLVHFECIAGACQLIRIGPCYSFGLLVNSRKKAITDKNTKHRPTTNRLNQTPAPMLFECTIKSMYIRIHEPIVTTYKKPNTNFSRKFFMFKRCQKYAH